MTQTIDIQERDQFQFNGLEPKHLNNFASQVWFVENGKKAVVFRQLTKTGIVSKNRSKQFVLSYDEISEHGEKLSTEERVYPDLPKDLDKSLGYLESEGMEVSNQRKRDVIDILNAHNTDIMNNVTELQEQARKIQEKVREYQESIDNNPEPEELLLEEDEEFEVLETESEEVLETEPEEVLEEESEEEVIEED